MTSLSSLPTRSRFLGCLLGGAVGDALGAPVEFLNRTQILDRFGQEGITTYAPAYGRLGAITDDTQMTLFTAEGLLRSYTRLRFKGITTFAGVTAHAYLRWLLTQGERPSADISFGKKEPGWLIQHTALHSRRAPGATCLSALRAMAVLGNSAQNNSKGCGGVMRMAPVGLYSQRLGQQNAIDTTFHLGTQLAALTHGHPTGALSAGVLAVLILALANGESLTESLATATTLLRAHPAHEETLRAINHAQELARSSQAPIDAIAKLGHGWIAEEALAIAIYCALVARDFRHGVLLAVNHDGDSDSTGSIAGNLLGTMYGISSIPSEWLEALELRDVITEMAEDLYHFKEWEMGEYSQNSDLSQRIWLKYPGH